MAEYNIYKEHNLETLKRMADNSLDAVVTDAPYGLGKEPDPLQLIQAWSTTGYMEIKGKGFMGKEWDAFVPQPAFWKEVYRVLKPGGYVLCFFGTRTYDWGTLAMRLAGFEIRDCIQWIYGSGFPKSLNVSKAIDKAAGVDRIIVREHPMPAGNKKGGNTLNMSLHGMPETSYITASTTNEAKIWDGYGTALKPAYEPICVARKPLDGTVAENVLKHQCGAINIDECRLETRTNKKSFGSFESTKNTYSKFEKRTEEWIGNPLGRFPSNLIIDDFILGIIDEQSGITGGDKREEKIQKGSNGDIGFTTHKDGSTTPCYQDIGGASRFFYCAKSSPSDRDYGLSGEGKEAGFRNDSGRGLGNQYNVPMRKNNHPTVKPISLMRYLVRLVKTPFDTCTIADFFLGSGTTGIACMLEGINFVGSESEEESFDTAERRISFAQSEYIKEQAKPKQSSLF